MTPSTLLVTDDGLPRGVSGAADPPFANVVKLFSQLFPGRRFGGGALSVYIDGVPVVDVWTGWSDRAGTQRWTADTGAMVFSATKGVASTVIHRLADRGLLSYDDPVAEYWPEFAANGKADITIHDVLRHRSGLSHLRGVTKTELMDHLLMEERLAAAPVGHLRGVQAYHALTYGWLLSGLARAVTGKGMRELIRQEVASPLNTDGLHLGRPPEGAPTRVAQVLMPQGKLRTPVFNLVAPRLAGLPFSGALGAMYFPGVVSLVKGDTPFLDGEVPAANGVVTGRGLAKMYAVLANDGRIDGKKYLSEELV
ncbi:MAG TPA: serine hydrolase domain-containing protein, partial [Mycobacterium sp.]|nr:serine hydrolase domain-containing protein [Mycobacterium sp.]